MKTLPIIHFVCGALALVLVLELVDWFFSLVVVVPFATAVASVVLIRRSPVVWLVRVQLGLTGLAVAALLGECGLVRSGPGAGEAWRVLLALLLWVGLVLPWFMFTVFHGLEVLSRREREADGWRPGLRAHAVAAVTVTAGCAGLAAGVSAAPEAFSQLVLGALAFLAGSVAVWVAGRTGWFQRLPAERQRSSLWLLAGNAAVAVLVLPLIFKILLGP